MTTDTHTHLHHNVDTSEIDKFNAVAHRWWDLEGEFKPLHQINPLRVNYINEKVDLVDRVVVDIGCGGGILSEALAHRGAKTTGIDMGALPLEVAKNHAIESHLEIEYHQSTAEAFAQQHPESFEVVTCLEMLEHVPDPHSIIQACATLCKPGGHLFFSTINRNPKSYVMAILGAEYLLNLVPKGTHDYGKLIKPSELAEWIRHAGLELIELKGLVMNPLTGQFKLSKDVDVNYFAYCRKPI